jgi:hypothetical protein
MPGYRARVHASLTRIRGAGRYAAVVSRTPTTLADLDELVAAITVDAYGDDEPQAAFLEVFNQEVRLPMVATVLAMPVDVIRFDYLDERFGIVAECRRGNSRQIPVPSLAAFGLSVSCGTRRASGVKGVPDSRPRNASASKRRRNVRQPWPVSIDLMILPGRATGRGSGSSRWWRPRRSGSTTRPSFCCAICATSAIVTVIAPRSRRGCVS